MKKKREHKVSRGEHGGGGKVRLTERERPASIRGGLVQRTKAVGTVNHNNTRENKGNQPN